MIDPQPIKDKALSLGFDLCGVARSRILTEHKERLSQWVEMGHHGNLGYMERNIDKRIDPSSLVESASSVIVCAISYNRQPITEGVASRIASYATTIDYHTAIREKLNALLSYIAEIVPKVSGRVFVDTAPILEKAWAVNAGLGWVGRNSLLINPTLGSFLLLGVVVIDAEIEADAPYQDNGCGGCRKCLDLCPTTAINGDRTINASKCISRLTIERVGTEDTFEQNLHGWVFGCDVCQKSCPHNQNAPILNHDIFKPNEVLLSMSEEQFLQLTEEEYHSLFGDTPLGRCSLNSIQRRLFRP